MYRHHINNGMTPLFAQLREDFLSFVRAYKIVSKNTLNILHTLFNYFFVIGTAILPKKALQNIHRHICAFLNFLGQIFANNLPIKVLTELVLYFFTGTATLFKKLHYLHLLRVLTKEIKLIHRKSDVNLELLTLGHLQALFICNNQIISCCITIFQ